MANATTSSSGPTPDSGGLDSAADFIKVSTGFAAGSLVFSVGLVNSASNLSNNARGFIFLAWITLFVAMVAGVLAFSRIPIQKAAKDYDLEDKFLTTPLKLHQISFALGVVFLGISLFLTLSGEAPASEQSAASALEALALAEPCVPKEMTIKRVSVIEGVKGIDATRPSLVTWHVQFETTRKNDPPSNATSLSYIDVFVDARRGLASSLGVSPCPSAKIHRGVR
jgi:uncharacterized membrane protein YiaA